MDKHLDLVHFLRQQVWLEQVIKLWAGRARVKLRQKFVACDKCEVPESAESEFVREERTAPLKHPRQVDDDESDHDIKPRKEIDIFCFCSPQNER